VTEIRLGTVALRRSNVEHARGSSRYVLAKGKYKYMLAVIGNVIAGLGVLSLFTATLRLTKPGKKP